jgi:plasmid stabilization system protein ParE
MTPSTDTRVSAGFTAEELVAKLAYAAKSLGYEEGAQRDPDLYEYTRVDEAKAAILAYIALLREEIAELGEVAKGCAKREAAALTKARAAS